MHICAESSFKGTRASRKLCPWDGDVGSASPLISVAVASNRGDGMDGVPSTGCGAFSQHGWMRSAGFGSVLNVEPRDVYLQTNEHYVDACLRAGRRTPGRTNRSTGRAACGGTSRRPRRSNR